MSSSVISVRTGEETDYDALCSRLASEGFVKTDFVSEPGQFAVRGGIIDVFSFSFNNPFGACPVCHGLGFKQEIDPALICRDPNKSLREGAMTVTGWNLDTGKMSEMYFSALENKR